MTNERARTEASMEFSIQEIAKVAGTTSRTLRHYDDIGLLAPSSVGVNGYRYYDQVALVRLQRILLLRALGLGLPQIADVLALPATAEDALTHHLAWLRQEQDRLGRQIVSVQTTIDAMRGGEQLMAHDMFDGFDHRQYETEVTQKWGSDAYERGDAWWRGLAASEKDAWKQASAQLAADWIAAARSAIAADSDEAQALAERHVQWLTGIPGTPAADPAADLAGYVTGLGAMYVADPRFAANYGGESGAMFVRDALRAYVERSAPAAE